MEKQEKPINRHICLTKRAPMGISDDPEYDILTALADKDVLIMARGLSTQPTAMPFTGGIFGLTEKEAEAAVRKMKAAGLISTRREGDFHVYYLNAGRYRELAKFLNNLADASEKC